ncbi:MAG: Extracellular ribonuclease precursor [Bacteroidetes bacterium ADurb.Bin035]|jgi:endonuclease I|nr:endonuclease [Bacteroidales bacterium]OQC45167.1 MAG: Extracellular ribonuclease precursor [Bacteroidetes bacterium ADurb.Bin035]HCM29846.1 endonuclease I [Bacteroidales bacterium]HNY76196.1 endonuclease [Bacteroidales bacterium]HOC40831.1 endonuclease [Bacteroidales bacterium]
MKYLLVTFFSFITILVFSQIPNGYYDNAEGKYGQELRVALYNIIKTNVTSISYSELWDAYPRTDKKSNGKVWDIYSDIPNGTPPYEFTFITDQCGNYSGEGDCYNREHTVPASWFNDASPMYSDLFHVLPTDGYVNNRRSNYPYGKVGNASWTSLNGSKLGSSATSGYSGTVFEPIDSFKGDIARIYFYMSTRYMDKIANWDGASFQNSDLSSWAKNLFLQWHQLDPVSSKERKRNDSVYVIQHNRNPFVDHPEWVNDIWGPTATINNYDFVAYLYTTNDAINVNFVNTFDNLTIKLFSIQGQLIYDAALNNSNNLIIPITFNQGVYILTIYNDQNIYTEKIVIE